jgi:ABC-2 type transport system ATP-binding protein
MRSSTAAMPHLAAAAAAATAAAGGVALAIDQLTVRYGASTAVDAVSLAVAEGTVYALLGRNGSGKSSLVRCLLGQQRPTAGCARVFGRDSWRERAALMAMVGVVAEQPDAPPAASALALARFCKPLYRHWDGAGFVARLRRFGVPAELPFGRLSKGQQRQVALALALAGRPRVLVLDDPTLGLDVVARRAFFDELIGELADRGVTVLLTTHELAAVERLAERVGILAGGKLLVDEDLESLKRRFRRIRVSASGDGEATGLPAAADPALAALAPLGRTENEWGAELIVAGYDPDRHGSHGSLGSLGSLGSDIAEPSGLARMATAEVTPLSLEEIFVALVGAVGDPSPRTAVGPGSPPPPGAPMPPGAPGSPASPGSPESVASPASPAALGTARLQPATPPPAVAATTPGGAR